MNITGCDAKNAKVLQHLVEHGTCDVVTLSQKYYMCMSQISVRHHHVHTSINQSINQSHIHTGLLLPPLPDPSPLPSPIRCAAA
jgi:hypothetical protein